MTHCIVLDALLIFSLEKSLDHVIDVLEQIEEKNRSRIGLTVFANPELECSMGIDLGNLDRHNGIFQSVHRTCFIRSILRSRFRNQQSAIDFYIDFDKYNRTPRIFFDRLPDRLSGFDQAI